MHFFIRKEGLHVGCWVLAVPAICERTQELAKPAVLVVDSTGGIFIDLLASLGTTQVILVRGAP